MLSAKKKTIIIRVIKTDNIYYKSYNIINEEIIICKNKEISC